MKRVKRSLTILASILGLLLLVRLLTDTLLIKRDDGIIPMKAYYYQPQNTVDVLVLGSSQAGMNLSNRILWEEYGISDYMLWSSVQPFWTSYYWLIEALKTQAPKVVVLETYAASRPIFEYVDEARQVTSIEGMRPSLNKWRAIQASAPPERWLDLMAVLPVIHARYGELEEKDFQYYPWTDLSADKGSRVVRELTLYFENGGGDSADEVAAIREVKPLSAKAELYLNKIIDLCREKAIPLLLLKTPSPTRIEEQPYYNRVAQIAEENGIPYLNFNLLDDETDYNSGTDMGYDSHMNTRGIGKITRYLAEYLKANYGLADHRGDPQYESWELSARQTENAQMPLLTDMADYFAELAKSHYLCYLVKAYGRYEMTEGYAALIEQAAQIDDAAGHIAASMKDEWGFDIAAQCAGPEEENWIHGEEEKAEMGFAVDVENRAVLFNGKKLCEYRDNAIEMVVYDPYTKKCVDVLEFRPEEAYALKRFSTAVF